MVENYRLDLTDEGLSCIFYELRDFFRLDDLSDQDHSLRSLHQILDNMNVLDLDEPANSPRRNRPAFLAGLEFDVTHSSAASFMKTLQDVFQDPDMPLNTGNLGSLRKILSGGLGLNSVPAIGNTDKGLPPSKRDWNSGLESPALKELPKKDWTKSSAASHGERKPLKDWSKKRPIQPTVPPKIWNK